MFTRHPALVSVVMLISMLALTPLAVAQNSTAALERQLKLDGNKLWVVIKGSLQDFTGKADSAVADFDSEKEAREAAQRLNTALKGDDAYKWLYSYRKQRQDESNAIPDLSGGRGKPIVKPELKSADPGPLKTIAKATPTIKGKCGKGKIGKAAVTICFKENGELEITGDVEGKGKWEQTGTAVTLSTQISTFRGTIEGTKVSGLRFVRDNSQPLIEWTVELLSDESVLTGKADDPIVGAWKHEKSQDIYKFVQGGTGYWIGHGSHYSVKWQRNGTEVKVDDLMGIVNKYILKDNRMDGYAGPLVKLTEEDIKKYGYGKRLMIGQ